MTPIIGHALLWAIIDLAGLAPPLPGPIETAIAQAFPEPHLYQQALTVSHCESRHNPQAIGDNGASIGLFQIQPKWWSRIIKERNLLNPQTNANIARQLYNIHQDWRYWTCQP